MPKDWKTSYFAMFLEHKSDQPILKGLLAALLRAGNAKDNDDLAAVAVAFVQSAIAYDWKTAYQITGGRIRYPGETLLDAMGVCADKTILLAALLRQLGFGLAILSWERANHMALGIKVPGGYGNFGTPFAMVETTAVTPIGKVPERYAGGIKLDVRPEVVELKGGNTPYEGIIGLRKQEQELQRQFGAEYLAMPPAQQALFREMQPLKTEMEALAEKLKACSGNLPPAKYAECQSLHAQHNAKVKQYNALVSKFNAVK
jgi:hypothetical protein